MEYTETKPCRKFTSTETVVLLAFLFFAFGGAVSARQFSDLKEPATPQSNAQSTSQTPPAAMSPQDAPRQIPPLADQTIGILSRRSIFFPDLATTLKPLSPEQKFKLSLDETIAPSTLVSASITAG